MNMRVLQLKQYSTNFLCLFCQIAIVANLFRHIKIHTRWLYINAILCDEEKAHD